LALNYDPVIDLDVTNPMRRVSDIEAIISFGRRAGRITIFSVTPARRSPYFNMVEGRNGFCRISKPFSSSVHEAPGLPGLLGF